MKSIEIKLQNCFGIGKLDHTFNFELLNTNTFLIYAPNGTMKTSFAKTLDLISKNDPKTLPADIVYDGRETKHSILVDGNAISPDSILVVNAEDANYDTSSKISSFIARKELKRKYDEIYSELDNKKTAYLKKLKEVSKSADCETEFVNAFSQSDKDSFFELLSSRSKALSSKPVKYDFRYNDIFDKKNNVKKFLEKNQQLLSKYINDYNDLLAKSKFFKSSTNSFGTFQANELLKSTADNSYFDAGHKFTLGDNVEIKSANELKELLQNEITSIVNDEKLKKTFDQVDKAIGANDELRSFKSAIEKDNALLIKLENYEDFRKNIWLNYISLLSAETQELAEFYESKKNEIESIVQEAKKEFEIWVKIIKTFNERFYVTFESKLVNQDDVILKEKTAYLEFEYKDGQETPIRKDKNSLLLILSKGEQRAFYILQLLFDIESRKQLNQKTLLVLDDIADSFDYKNKYAIIEYVKEINHNEIFRLIILTHNFDFYRTVGNRLGLNRQAIFMVIKNEAREIKLGYGEYLKNIFDHFKNNLSKAKFFISIIPLVRNLTEYIDTKGQESDNYALLTSCLHLKADTGSINCDRILQLIHTCFPVTSMQNISFGTKPIKTLIYETGDAIEMESSINEILLENKIPMSIAIRLKAEEFMLSKIPNASSHNLSTNQTAELLTYYKQSASNTDAITILERVNLMTPENIHINAFMYEPLIDISILHLIHLYKKVKQLR
jgi:ABC-type dipeptide/oligopeptide/nickel transport system ATPase component